MAPAPQKKCLKEKFQGPISRMSAGRGQTLSASARGIGSLHPDSGSWAAPVPSGLSPLCHPSSLAGMCILLGTRLLPGVGAKGQEDVFALAGGDRLPCFFPGRICFQAGRNSTGPGCSRAVSLASKAQSVGGPTQGTMNWLPLPLFKS